MYAIMYIGNLINQLSENMNAKTTLSISEARREIFKIAEKVQKPSTYYTLTEKGKPKAVILSAEEFESWQEAMEVNNIFPNLEKDIKAADRDFKKKKCITLEEVLLREGFVLAGK